MQDRYIRRLLRLHQVVAYSGQSWCSQECAVIFVQFGNEKRFFVVAITQKTQCQRAAPCTVRT